MKSLLEQVDELDSLIHQMEKMISMMSSGRWIDAYRECNRLIAALNNAKRDAIAYSERDSEKDNEK